MKILHLLLALLILTSGVHARNWLESDNARGNNLTNAGTVQATNLTASTVICLAGDCRVSWPTGGSANVTVTNTDGYTALTTNGTNIAGALSATWTALRDAVYGNISALQSSNTTIFTQLTAVKAVDATQNTSITAAQADITAIKAVDATQNSTLSTRGNVSSSNGTVGYVARFTNSTNIATGTIYDNGTAVGIGDTPTNGAVITVKGNIYIPTNSGLSLGNTNSNSNVTITNSGANAATLRVVASGGTFISGQTTVGATSGTFNNTLNVVGTTQLYNDANITGTVAIKDADAPWTARGQLDIVDAAGSTALGIIRSNTSYATVSVAGGTPFATKLSTRTVLAQSWLDSTQAGTDFSLGDTAFGVIGATAMVPSLFIDADRGSVAVNSNTTTSNLTVVGNASFTSRIAAPEICLNGDCQTIWPSNTYTNVTNLQTSNTTVFAQLTSIKAVDATQNTSISTAQADITAIKVVDATQNSSITTAQADITAIKVVDATQNATLSGLYSNVTTLQGAGSGSGTGNITSSNLTLGAIPYAVNATHLAAGRTWLNGSAFVVGQDGALDTGYSTTTDMQVNCDNDPLCLFTVNNNGVGNSSGISLRGGTEDVVLLSNGSTATALQLVYETTTLLSVEDIGALNVTGTIHTGGVEVLNASSPAGGDLQGNLSNLTLDSEFTYGLINSSLLDSNDTASIGEYLTYYGGGQVEWVPAPTGGSGSGNVTSTATSGSARRVPVFENNSNLVNSTLTVTSSGQLVVMNGVAGDQDIFFNDTTAGPGLRRYNSDGRLEIRGGAAGRVDQNWSFGYWSTSSPSITFSLFDNANHKALLVNNTGTQPASLAVEENITAYNTVAAPQICLNGDCQTAWPSGGNSAYENVTNLQTSNTTVFAQLTAIKTVDATQNGTLSGLYSNVTSLQGAGAGSGNVTSTSTSGALNRIAYWTNNTNLGNSSASFYSNGDLILGDDAEADVSVYFNSTATGPGFYWGRTSNRMFLNPGPNGRIDWLGVTRTYITGTADFTMDLYRDGGNRLFKFENSGTGEANVEVDDKLGVNATPSADSQTLTVTGGANVTDTVWAGNESCRAGVCFGRRNYLLVNVSSSANATAPLINLNMSLIVPPNRHVRYECELLSSASAATTGIRLQVNTTGSPSYVQSTYWSMSSASAFESFTNASTTSNWYQDTGSSTATSPSRLIVDMRTSTNPSNVTVEATGEVAAAWLIREGSWCEYSYRY